MLQQLLTHFYSTNPTPCVKVALPGLHLEPSCCRAVLRSVRLYLNTMYLAPMPHPR